MRPTSYSIAHGAARRMQRTRRRERSAGPDGGTRRWQLSEWLSGLPRWVHAAPYLALATLGGVLLIPGVVPHGPACGEVLGVDSPSERQLFIQQSAVAFGLVAALFLLSALAASGQRRAGRPGRPTIVSCALLGAVTLAAVISPHAPLAAPAQAAMAIDIIGALATRGAALLIPAVAGAVAWSTMSGPRSLRAAQIAAWTVLLLGLPLVMALTYVTVTPICFG